MELSYTNQEMELALYKVGYIVDEVIAWHHPTEIYYVDEDKDDLKPIKVNIAYKEANGYPDELLKDKPLLCNLETMESVFWHMFKELLLKKLFS